MVFAAVQRLNRADDPVHDRDDVGLMLGSGLAQSGEVGHASRQAGVAGREPEHHPAAHAPADDADALQAEHVAQVSQTARLVHGSGLVVDARQPWLAELLLRHARVRVPHQGGQAGFGEPRRKQAALRIDTRDHRHRQHTPD